MADRSFRSAINLARRAALGRPFSAPANGRRRTVRVSLGDPQAPLACVLDVLARNGLLAASGRLRDEVQLVSVGDHFDWGKRSHRAAAADDGTAILAWLALHPADQVILCAGNHDLARVGELAEFDDARFAQAQAEADAAHVHGGTDPAKEAALLAKYPQFPSAEFVSRDLSSFRAVQREWVSFLLTHRRLRLAHAAGPSLLITHASITLDELSALGLSSSLAADAGALARALNLALDLAWSLHTQGPLHVPGLHVPGSASSGEGRGMLYHRASTLQAEAALATRAVPRRRYSPFRLPPGLTQVIGHIRDAKSRRLLGLEARDAKDGVLRHLRVEGRSWEYGHGPRPLAKSSESLVLYVDGSLRACPGADYELLDLETLQRWAPPSAWTGD
jgi:hypothetical protein